MNDNIELRKDLQRLENQSSLLSSFARSQASHIWQAQASLETGAGHTSYRCKSITSNFMKRRSYSNVIDDKGRSGDWRPFNSVIHILKFATEPPTGAREKGNETSQKNREHCRTDIRQDIEIGPVCQLPFWLLPRFCSFPRSWQINIIPPLQLRTIDLGADYCVLSVCKIEMCLMFHETKSFLDHRRCPPKCPTRRE